ncbi:MerR family DNA-binding transcriptional regulator [Actinomadura sp. ATCC 31491]|uniref:MerR family DNA-binding transcriptional regulator n=1 Tax=Actinomadura luzonensis TaxID=2805427 RepID=A0ABT0G1Z5_9ACTN|nr:MerR family DNA-binding transcriptional regulator [Actinomadura luzonensis]MCK2218143.1 MerR family DNA-binding transcriptional regulator [Actinomadura luzonensis]
MNGVTIGQAAAFVGITVKTVRHYHKLGLVTEPEATAGTDRPSCCGWCRCGRWPPPGCRWPLDQRLNLITATNQNSRWLFPGRRGGQPMTPDAIERRLRDHQIPIFSDRTAALRQLVLQAPAAVIARMLGYSDEQTSRVATEAGSPWSRYAPVDEHPHA